MSNLIENASSVDWQDTGERPVGILDTKDGGTGPLPVELDYATDGSSAAVLSVVDRLVEAGSVPRDDPHTAIDRGRAVVFERGDWEVLLRRTELDDQLGLMVRVRLDDDDDDRAADILAPIREVLGSVA